MPDDPPDDPDPYLDDGPDPDDATAAKLAHNRMVNDQLRKLRAQRDARRIMAAEDLNGDEPLDIAFLRDVLARPKPPADRIEGLAKWDGSTLITAPRKAGKTTLMGNLARSLLTGEQFLGRFAVKPLDGVLAILNYEMTADQLAAWLVDIGANRNRLLLVNLRSRANPLIHDRRRAEMVRRLRDAGAEALVCDTFVRTFTGESQNDAGQVTQFLTDLDYLTRTEVGARDLFLTNHTGWQGERSRGSTALEDWPDAIWRIVRPAADDDNNSRARYFTALGRDVDVPEDELCFDRASRRLTLTGNGSRLNATAARQDEKTRATILDLLGKPENAGGLSGAELAELAGNRKDKGFTDARDALVTAGRLVRVNRSGRGGGYLYTLPTEPTEPTENLPNPVPTEPTEPPLIGGGSGSGGSKGQPTEHRTCDVCCLPMASYAELDETTHPNCSEAPWDVSS